MKKDWGASFMRNIKRNAVIVVALLFVCAAVYLNWSYNNKWGDAGSSAAKTEEAATDADYEASLLTRDGEEEPADAETDPVSDYFAMARLTRQQSRDEALNLLQLAISSEAASQETIDTAMSEISAMATCSLLEAQIENVLLAKEFVECVVFISDGGVTVAVPAPLEGLSEAAVARITDVITSETEFTAQQIRVIEIKNAENSQPSTDDPSMTEDGGETWAYDEEDGVE